MRERFGLLRQAAELVASPQIRNQGTIGGNVSQDTRCWYYRAGWSCYRAGGNICYADTPQALNREHAILEADRCVAVNPSDTAPALVALDASMVVRGPGGERVLSAEDLLHRARHRHHPHDGAAARRAADGDPHPGTWAGAQFYFEKVRDRNVWDFALVSVASAMVVSGGTIERMRLVVNGVAARPLRLAAVEQAVADKPANEATAAMAGELAIGGARAAAAQRLQGAVDAQPGQARDSRRRGGHMDFLTWARSPWGEDILTHISWDLALGVALRRRRVLSSRTPATWCSPRIASATQTETDALEAARPRTAGPHQAPFAPARLFHWVMAAAMFVLLFTAFLPIAGVQFPMGDVALDGRRRPHRVDPVSHHPRHRSGSTSGRSGSGRRMSRS